MNKVFISFAVIFLYFSPALAQKEAWTATGEKVLLFPDGTWEYFSLDAYPEAVEIEIPFAAPEDIIRHTAFSLAYNDEHEQARWVAYELTKEETNSIYKRTNKFLVDRMVKGISAEDKDYYRSGYDRGHLAPAADMGWSAEAMKESFYYSNMSPQKASFNRGIWRRLETLVRSWAVENEAIYIVTGGVLTDGLPTIGKNRVSVPQYFYKVILDYTEPDLKGIAFIMPNEGSSHALKNFAVTIDSVENLTGINFFHALPNETEEILEKECCLECWQWPTSK